MKGDPSGVRRPEVPGPGEPWTVMRLVLWSAAYLTDKGLESGRLDAEHLLADALGTDRLQLYLQFDRPLLPEELGEFKGRLKRRAGREPLQYILGRTAFRELELRTDPRALIPRPETEELVSLVLERSRPAEGGLTALDVGTGSGAIALSLLVEGPFVHVVATDTSDDALGLARENAASAGVQHALELRTGNLWEALAPGERFDVIVSNPPYVRTEELAELQPEIGAWEPASALDGGERGLDVLAPLVRGAAAHMRPGGLLAVEVGEDQGPDALELARTTAGLAKAEIRRDLAGRQRFLVAVAAEGTGPAG